MHKINMYGHPVAMKRTVVYFFKIKIIRNKFGIWLLHLDGSCALNSMFSYDQNQ